MAGKTTDQILQDCVVLTEAQMDELRSALYDMSCALAAGRCPWVALALWRCFRDDK